jgi:hypothetical protein
MSAYTRLYELGYYYQDRVWGNIPKGAQVGFVVDRATMTGLVQTKYLESYHLRPFLSKWSPFTWHCSPDSAG